MHHLLAGVGAGVAAPLMAETTIKKQDNNTMKTNPVSKTKPLGFVWETLDPFLFCVHHDDKFPAGNEQMGPAKELLKGRSIGQDFVVKDGFRMYHGQTVPGFPHHPHKGFETITMVRKGLVDHADSMGAAGRYGNGDVQWMTAGKGVQHSEMFPLLHPDKENPMELFQIWINLPKASKKASPYFRMMWSEEIPKVEFKDARGKKTKIEVIVGTLLGKTAPTPPPDSWAHSPGHEVAIWNLHLEAGAEFTLPAASAGTNRVLYLYEGDGIQLHATPLKNYHSAELLASVPVKIQNGSLPSKILILQGKPIGEPVVQHGPFVMNTIEEIHQAFAEYQRTEFGGWPWPKSDQVHPRDKGRFARHADGRIETRG